MPRGRTSTPTPLPEAFSSWSELYSEWERFLKTHKRSVHPSRAEIFAEMHKMPEWILGTLPYIFRTSERRDAAGEYARNMIKLIEDKKIGVPKANNEIRSFVKQNPMFRDKETQQRGLNEAQKSLKSLAELSDSLRNFNPDFTAEELERVFSNISVSMRKIQQLKNRLAITIRERKEESQLD
jgi:hypothetical protein